MRPCAVIIIALIALWAFPALTPLGPDAQLLHAQAITQQFGRKPADKGPRALGLVQISDTGKARLLPITIMMDGKFYDAGSYKATPVPMALDFGVVYEGFRAGVSQGVFTITQPGQLNHEWIAEGTWLPTGVKAPETTKKYAAPVIDEEKTDDRPVLHRRQGSSDTKGDEDKPATAPAANAPATAPPSGSPSPSAPSTAKPSDSTSPAPAPPDTTKNTTGDTTQDTSKDTSKAGSTKTAASQTTAEGQPVSDPNRPVLRRGKPDPNSHHEPFVNFDDPVEAAQATRKAGQEASKEASVIAASVKTVPAISDAGGPDPRTYAYDVKPAEEAIYRSKMFDLAATLLRPIAQPGAPTTAAPARTATAAHGRPPAKSAKARFDDVSLRIFDLSNSNEPVLVLSAKTQRPAAGATGSIPEPQEITLVARTNLEGELQKLFFAQTDSRHLDVSPRMELIDAVDADGDGRGELLFRRTYDGGSAYAIYRVTADRLWPLFEGTP